MKVNLTSSCFQGEPSGDALKIIECWIPEILEIAGKAIGLPKLAKFSSKQVMLDGEGNQFLNLVPYFQSC